MLDGQPLKGAFVYLKNWNGISSREGFSESIALVDSQGSYYLDNIYGDEGNIGLKVPWQLVHDKSLIQPWKLDLSQDTSVDFYFKEGMEFTQAYIEEGSFIYEIKDSNGSEESRYYMQVKNSSLDSDMERSYYKLEGNKGKIPVETLVKDADMSLGMVFYDDPVSLDRLTEHFYLSGDYYFQVMKDTESREEYMINGIFSDALKTPVHYQCDNEYNEGDRLVEADNIKEAKVWYEEHPTRHNLKALVYLNYYGYIPVESEYGMELKGKNIDEAIRFQEQLIELDGSTKKRLDFLQRLYNENYQYVDEGRVIEEILKGQPDVYDYFTYGYNLIHRGFYKEGLAVLSQYGDMEIDGDIYLSYFLLANVLEALSEEVGEAMGNVDNLDSYDEFHKLVLSAYYEEAWDFLVKQEDGDLKTMYKLLYLDSLEFEDLNVNDYILEAGYEKYDFIGYYLDSYDEIDDENIKKVLMLNKKDSNWFN